jgi:molecular chaperone DnaJ
MVFSKECDACGGEGRLASAPCRTCGGLGVAARHEVVTIPVPAGIGSGARLSVPGRGHAGVVGGPTGDLYVTVDVAEHPFFRREGRDVIVELPVQIHEAALGAVVEVPTADGLVHVRLPAGVISGQRLRVSDYAADGAESPVVPRDLYAEIQIVLPPKLDERSRELLREFGRRNTHDVRRDRYEPR